MRGSPHKCGSLGLREGSPGSDPQIPAHLKTHPRHPTPRITNNASPDRQWQHCPDYCHPVGLTNGTHLCQESYMECVLSLLPAEELYNWLDLRLCEVAHYDCKTPCGSSKEVTKAIARSAGAAANVSPISLFGLLKNVVLFSNLSYPYLS